MADDYFAGADNHSTLTLYGYAATIRNIDGAHIVGEEASLVPWAGDEETLVDRYDVRLLIEPLDILASRRPLKRARTTELDTHDAYHASEEEQLNFERYRDLQHGVPYTVFASHGNGLPTTAEVGIEHHQEEYQRYLDDEDATRDKNEDLYVHTQEGKAYGAVPFSYTTNSDDNDVEDNDKEAGQPAIALVTNTDADPGSNEAPFLPNFPIPHQFSQASSSTASALPSTQRQFEIMRKTADFIKQGGGNQLEIVLRVKQAGNPQFEFLKTENALHPFFRWLVTAEEQVFKAIKPLDAAPRVALAQNDGVSHQSPTGIDGDSAEPQVQEKHEQQEILNVNNGSNLGEPTVTALEGLVQYGVNDEETSEQPSSDVSNQQVMPPEQLAVVSKLVSFIQRSGPSFEAMVREKEGTNPKFSFLFPDQDPAGFAVYKQQLIEVLGAHQAQQLLEKNVGLFLTTKDTEGAQPSAVAVASEVPPWLRNRSVSIDNDIDKEAQKGKHHSFDVPSLAQQPQQQEESQPGHTVGTAAGEGPNSAFNTDTSVNKEEEEEAKKAERRRKVQELLANRRRAALTQVVEERQRQLSSNINAHKKMFLDDD